MTDNSASEATTNVPEGEAGLEHGAQPSTIGSPTHVGEPSSANATARPPSPSSYSGTAQWKEGHHYPTYFLDGHWRKWNYAFSQRVGPNSQWVDDYKEFTTKADRITFHILPVMPPGWLKPTADISMPLGTQVALAGAMRLAARVISSETEPDFASRIEGIYLLGSALLSHYVSERRLSDQDRNPDAEPFADQMNAFQQAAEREWLIFKEGEYGLKGLQILGTLLEKEDGDFLIWSAENDGDEFGDVSLKVHEPAEDGRDGGSEETSSV